MGALVKSNLGMNGIFLGLIENCLVSVCKCDRGLNVLSHRFVNLETGLYFFNDYDLDSDFLFSLSLCTF